MKKGQVFDGQVEDVKFPNKGIIFHEDKKVIVKNALLGQKVRFSINKVRKNKCEGKVLEILENSPLETREPVCKNFGQCGGCTYQRIEYAEQLKIKESQVRNLLDEVCNDYIFEEMIGNKSEWEYRNKMEFSFGDEQKDGPMSLGLHKKGSFHDVLTTSDCKIVNDDYNKILICVLDYFTKANTPFYHKVPHEGYLRHLLLRRGTKTGEMLINLITTSEEVEVTLEPLVEELLKLPLEGHIVGILHIFNDNFADSIQSDRTEILYGKDYFYEEILDLKFKISPFSFFQTNSLGAEMLYTKAREYIGNTKDKLVFDLYSGTGTIAQLLAPVAKKVIGVEIVSEAVEAAIENAKFNRLDNCEFIAGDVLNVIDTIAEKPDIIVLDPPREGIHPKALVKILNYKVDKIVYISCKPTSLAKDLIAFKENGYKVERVSCVDMFPETVHVETVCLLSHIE